MDVKSKRRLPIVKDPDSPKQVERKLLQIQEPARPEWTEPKAPEASVESK